MPDALDRMTELGQRRWGAQPVDIAQHALRVASQIGIADAVTVVVDGTVVGGSSWCDPKAGRCVIIHLTIADVEQPLSMIQKAIERAVLAAEPWWRFQARAYYGTPECDGVAIPFRATPPPRWNNPTQPRPLPDFMR